jgi:hypothetical protein
MDTYLKSLQWNRSHLVCRPTLVVLAATLMLSSPAPGAVVYMLSSGNTGLDAQTETTLESYGHVVDIGVQYHQFDGSQSLAGYECVLFLNNANWGMGDMPAAGQTALVDFVESGGGLVTGEWVMWTVSTGYLTVLEPALAAATDGSWNYASPITYTVVQQEPTLNAGVASAFTFSADDFTGTEQNIWAKSGANTFYDSDNWDAGVVGWDYGTGRTISFSTCIGLMELSDANYSRLLSNALTWSAKQGCGCGLNWDWWMEYDWYWWSHEDLANMLQHDWQWLWEYDRDWLLEHDWFFR